MEALEKVRPRSVRAARWIAWIAIALLIATAALVSLGSSSDTIQCPAFPSCLANPGSLVGFVHTSSAGVLVLLVLALMVLSLMAPARAYRITLPSIGAFIALIITATFGSLFATGTVPTSLAPLQYLWLGITLTLLVVVAARLRHLPSEPVRGV